MSRCELGRSACVHPLRHAQRCIHLASRARRSCERGEAGERVSSRRRKGEGANSLEAGHEAEGEDAADPVELERAASLLDEYLGLLSRADDVAGRLLRLATLEEVLGLGQAGADDSCECRDGSREVEEDAVVVVVLGHEGEVDDGGEEVLNEKEVRTGSNGCEDSGRTPTAYPCCKMPENMPRASTGMFSRPRAAERPQIPPMAIPKSERTARKVPNVLQYAVESDKAPQMRRSRIKGQRRP